MKIGVFDSGKGGRHMAEVLQKSLPEHDIVFKDDAANVPYGNRSADEIYALAKAKIDELTTDGCQLVVIACNTVTVTVINRLRAAIAIPIVGIEPMIKPAAEQTKSGTIAVFATPATLASSRYNDLKQSFAAALNVIEPDCHDWATLIEADRAGELLVEETVKEVVTSGADVIVLGCTHYHWLESRVRRAAGEGVVVLQPSDAIVRRVRQLLDEVDAAS
jgi:glutamate racemase